MKIVLLAGAPGSGKSSQGTLLVEKNSTIKHISLGNVMRKKLDDLNDPITKQYQDKIKGSELLPEEVIFEVVKDILKSEINEEVVLLLDGYPRVEAQYELFKKEYGLPYGIIHLQVEDRGVLIKRMQERTSRPDTDESVINKRLTFHEKSIAPLIEKIKEDFSEEAIIIVNTDDSASLAERNAFIYEQLKSIPEIRKTLEIGDNLKESHSTGELPEFNLVKTFFNNQTHLPEQHLAPQLRIGNNTK
jgi:adenylate kinase